MDIADTVYIKASINSIFELACRIQDWPSILPHYIDVDILESSEDGLRKVATMAANRTDFPVPGAVFPVVWTSVQLCDPSDHSVIFKHIRGVATGMWVRWDLTPDAWGRGVRVTITHSLRYGIPFMNGLFATKIVGQTFVSHIAGQTLHSFKKRLEQEQVAETTAN